MNSDNKKKKDITERFFFPMFEMSYRKKVLIFVSLLIGMFLLAVGIMMIPQKYNSGEQSINKKKVNLKKNSTFIDSISEKIELPKHTKELLINPINISEFRYKKGRSNSGGANVDTNIYHKPKEKGLYYRFFMFKNYGELRGPEVITYRKGNYSEYNSDFDTLILFYSDLPDKDLGELNLVGKSFDSIIKSFGVPNYRKNHQLIYYYDKRILAISKQWFKWAYLKSEVNGYQGIPNVILSDLRNLHSRPH